MELQESIEQLMKLLQSSPTLPSELIHRCVELRERLRAGHLHLAVLGQFKRGKSTLINALLGAEVLPEGVLPVTAVPVFLRFGSQPEAEIRYLNGKSADRCPVAQLRDFVAETENPGNRKNVLQVNLSYPAAALEQGIVLIDTPGIGSSHQHNTDTTVNLLPRCDAGVVVLSPDPPITAAELEFLRQLQPHVVRLMFVLNKIDYLDAESMVEVEHFLCETLQDNLGLESPTLFSVSARDGLEARLKDDRHGWESSGMSRLEEALLDLAETHRQTILGHAVQRKVINLISETDQLLALEQRALDLPLQVLAEKAAFFTNYADESRQQRREISDGLVGDEKRIREELEEAAARLRDRAQRELLRRAADLGIPTYEQEHIEQFEELASRFFDRARKKLGKEIQHELEETLKRRAGSAQAVRDNLRQEAAALLDIPHFPLVAEETIVELEEPSWSVKRLLTKPTPSGVEEFLPRSMREPLRDRRREEFVRELVTRNVEKIRYWLLRIIQESFRRFSYRIDAELEETIAHINHALRAGQERSRQHAESHEAVASDLAARRKTLGKIKRQIKAFHPIPENI